MTTPNRTLLREAVAAAILVKLNALDTAVTWTVDLGRTDNIPDAALPKACVYALTEKVEIIAKGSPRLRRHDLDLLVEVFVKGESAEAVEALLDQAAQAVDEALSEDSKLEASTVDVLDVRPVEVTYNVAESGLRVYGGAESQWAISYRTTSGAAP